LEQDFPKSGSKSEQDFDGIGKESHFIMVDCLDVLFCVLECIVGTNVGSCPFAEASHFFFCYQLWIQASSDKLQK
jgi:hypothetical protein